MNKKLFAKYVLSIAAIFSAAASGNAQTCPGSPGCLDDTFGIGGISTTYVATTDNNLSPGKGTVQSDGRILALADAHLNTGNSFTNVIIRFNTDGTLDSGFGSGGFVYMNWNGANNAFGNAYAIAIQLVGTEEKIIVAGSGGGGSSTLRVDRYNTDGSADTSFGTNGRVVLNAGYALAVAVQSDGKILTMGDVGALVRFNANGTPDSTFGSGGVVNSSAVKTRALAVQVNGKIIAGGYSTSKGKNAMTVARFNTNGSPDDGGRKDSTPADSFGTSGKTIVSFGSGTNESGSDAKIDINGKIVIAGSANGNFAVARLTASGQLDATFDGDGKATVDFNGEDAAQNLELQASGAIFLNGSAGQDTGIARLNSNGTLDTSFGQGGKVVSDFSSTKELIRDGVIQIDPICSCEKLVILGVAETSGIDYAIAARYVL